MAIDRGRLGYAIESLVGPISLYMGHSSLDHRPYLDMGTRPSALSRTLYGGGTLYRYMPLSPISIEGGPISLWGVSGPFYIPYRVSLAPLPL